MTPPIFDINDEYQGVWICYQEVDALLQRPDTELFEAIPAVSRWSVGQHLFHLAKANKGVFSWMLRQRESEEPADADGPLAKAPDLRVLVEGRFPRGRVQAPSIVQPPEAPERAELEALVRKTQERLEALAPHLGVLQRSQARLPHIMFGPLTPAQWMRFARIHTAHHLAIVREILAQHA